MSAPLTLASLVSMKSKGTKSSASASLVSARLASASRQIDVLDDQILPHVRVSLLALRHTLSC